MLSIEKDRSIGYLFGIFALIGPAAILIVRMTIPHTSVIYENHELHTFLDTLSCFLAISLGILLYVLHNRLEWSSKFLWISCSLLSLGVLTGVHSAFSRDDNTVVVMETLDTLVGGCFAAMCWLPNRYLASPRKGFAAILLATAISLILGIWVVNSPTHIPLLVKENKFLYREAVLSTLGGVLFLIGALRCFIDYTRSWRIKDLYATDFLLLSGLSSALPSNLLMWGPAWWSWHLIQLVGFLAVLALFVYIGACFEQDLSQSEHRFRLLSDELKYANRDLKQFASFASHDLKEPVRTVQSYLTLLDRRYAESLDNDGKEFLRFAMDGAHRMRDLIEGFLHYARLDSANNIYVTVELSDVMDQVKRNIRLLLEESGATLQYRNLPAITGDKPQLVDLFQNIIVNAVRYRHPNRVPLVEITAIPNKGGWVIAFKDNGVGIAKEFREVIFEPLRRLHGNEVEGSGLGLAICQRIVERHGGLMTLDSKVGEGTTFSISFPPLPAKSLPKVLPSMVAIRKG